MPLQINAADLKLAVSYGSVGNGDSNMRSMINKIMESIYTRQYMATHSYTGKASPANKRARIPAKPALPVDDRKAIRGK
jgi:phage gpG-like protein